VAFAREAPTELLVCEIVEIESHGLAVFIVRNREFRRSIVRRGLFLLALSLPLGFFLLPFLSGTLFLPFGKCRARTPCQSAHSFFAYQLDAPAEKTILVLLNTAPS
jgi:hypothetical protein